MCNNGVDLITTLADPHEEIIRLDVPVNEVAKWIDSVQDTRPEVALVSEMR